MDNRRWWQFVKGKEFGPRSAQLTEDWIVIHATAKYAQAALDALERLDRIKWDCSESIYMTLQKRWKQIFEICKSAMQGTVSQTSGQLLEFESPELLEKVGLADPESWVFSERHSEW